MPMLPNTSDVDSKAVNPDSLVLPEADGINSIENKVEAPNFVEKKADFLPTITPPNDFVSKKLDQFGQETYNNRTIDVEFESYLADKEKTLGRKAREVQVQSDKDRFMKMSDDILNSQKEEVSKIESNRKQAMYGVADFAQEAINAGADFKNTARRYFGMSELENIPDLTSNLPEPQNNQERFIRSTTKFMTGLIPTARILKGITGVAGVANAVASSGIYGFLFDDSQTEGLVNTFVKENVDLGPDVLKYLNHQIDDNKFVTRLKNSANYTVDALAFEGIFYGLKMARNLTKGRSEAYKILENGDVELKATSKKTSEPSLFETVVPQNLPKVAGLTTEDIGKKSVKDTIEEQLTAVRKDIQTKYDSKQAANPDRMIQGRSEALKEIEKNPMSLKQLLAIKENQPVNNLVTMQAEMAQEALTRVSDNIMKGVTSGSQDPEIAIYKLTNIASAIEQLSFPRSTSGRSLEAAKFISDMGEADKMDADLLKKMRDVYGKDARMIFDEYKLVKENLTGFPVMDATLNVMRKNIDLEKVWKGVSSARINWILSDPTVHTANVMSNATTMGLRSATEVTAAGISKARTLFGNQYLQRGLKFNESKATVQGYYGGMMKGFKIISDNLAMAASKEPNNFKSLYSRDSNTKYNSAIDKLIENSETANNFDEGTLGKKIAKTLGHIVIGTPVGKMLSWEDDFFKGMHYMAEVNKQLTIKESQIGVHASTIEDAKEASDYTAREMGVVNKIRDNFKNGILDEAIDKAAKDSANYWTFNSELVGEDSITKLLKAGEVSRNESEIVRWFIPFYRTGANIANMSLEYTPVIGGIVKMGNVGGVAGLVRGGVKEDTLIAKQVIGSAIFASAAVAYSLLEDTFGVDFQMSSIKNNKVGLKIGAMETTIDKQTPVFKIFAATKDIMDIANIAGQTDGASAAASAAAALLMEMYSPEQMIQLLGTVSDIANAKSDLDSKFVNMLKMNVLSQVTPYSGAARFIQRDIVGMNKVVHGQEKNEDLLDEMIKRIKHTYLGDDAEIPARRGIFGQEIPYLRTMGYSVSDNAHDMFAGYNLDDPTLKEIMNLTREEVVSNPQNYDSFELNNTTMLSMPGRTIALPTGEAYELSPREYSDYVKFSAGEHPVFKGKTLKSTLDNLVASDKYQKLPPAFRSVAIKDVVELYRKAAKGILLNDHVDIMISGKEALMRLKKEYENVK